MSLSGKVFAITGGSSGIGLASAKALSERGATVCIADINDSTLAEVGTYFKEKGVKHSITKVDVSKRNQVDKWIEDVVAQFGRLDGAANIAGVMTRDHAKGKVVDIEDDEWDRIISINLTGCMYCLRAELRHIVDGGSIVNMASIHGTQGGWHAHRLHL